jgi:hypothetical protein
MNQNQASARIFSSHSHLLFGNQEMNYETEQHLTKLNVDNAGEDLRTTVERIHNASGRDCV